VKPDRPAPAARVQEAAMTGRILLYLGAALPLLWGAAHLVPTRSILEGFGDSVPDNRRIVAMEWIGEGVALIFLGLFVFVVTLIDPSTLQARAVYAVAFVMLNTLSLVSLFTGFKNGFILFKLCPVIFTASSLLILAGALA
jgi:hypothetical protein